MDIEKGVIEEGVRCRCCGRWIKADYLFCIPCVRKRLKVYNDSCGAGLSDADAWGVVEKAYPQKFR